MKTQTINIDDKYLLVSDEKIMCGDSWVYICPITVIEYGDNGNAIVDNNIPDSMRWFERLHDKDNYWKVVGYLNE